MILAFALAAAVLFGAGAYLLMMRDLVRVVIGVVLISQSAVLTVIAAALTRGQAPIYPLRAGAPVSDPVTQAMALTGIVIGLAITVLLLVLVARVYAAFQTIERDEVAEAEAAYEAELERLSPPQHEPEEPVSS